MTELTAMSAMTTTPTPFLIDRELLDAVGSEAKGSPRRRKNHNFHAEDAAIAHRLLNAIEPGSYLMPHRHLDAHKDETIIVLRGRLGVVFFDDSGQVQQAVILAPAGAVCGVDIPHGVYHTVLALETGTVMFEAKAGPYPVSYTHLDVYKRQASERSRAPANRRSTPS